jgi:hypothetical protein
MSMGFIMLRRFIGGLLLAGYALTSWAIAPYVQGDRVPAGNIAAVSAAVEKKLADAGFQVLGHYAPKGVSTHGVVVAVDPATLAKVREIGGAHIVAAPIRIGVSEAGEVSYTNPDYWYRAYLRARFQQAAPTVQDLQARLAKTLGAGARFGGDEAAKDLPTYRYMVGMERFDDKKNLLAKHADFDAAVRTVEENLKKGVAGTSKVYELVLPEKKLAVFGVAMNNAETGDASIINKIGVADRIAGLPYEIFVVNNEVHAFYGRYRLALAFPDLSMGHFMRIVYAPEEIHATLTTVAGGKKR